MASEEGIVPYKNAIFSPEVDFSAPINYLNFKGKTIVITGGASGLGAGFFEEFARHGANVIIGDINEKLGTSTVARIRQSSKNDDHHFVKLNVTDWKSQAEFFKQAARLSVHGGIDCVIANAGIADDRENAAFENPPDYSSMDNPPAPTMRTLDINLNGVMYTTNLAISYLSRNQGSRKCSPDAQSATRDRHLMLISSIAGTAALPTQPIYCTSKHGVLGLFRSLRITMPIVHGIRINVLHPYFVDTPILGPAGALVLAGGGMAKVEDVVSAGARLVADQSIIGRALMIGSRASVPQMRAAGFAEPYALEDGKAVWDIHGDDFQQTEVFTRRVIAVTNIVTSARGWSGMFSDIGTKLGGALFRLIPGYG